MSYHKTITYAYMHNYLNRICFYRIKVRITKWRILPSNPSSPNSATVAGA